MKYQDYKKPVPHEKRAEINDKILHLIHTNTTSQFGITPEMVYNYYSGDGGLSGVQFKDYSSFHSFTKAKQEFENGQFFTPHSVAESLVSMLGVPTNSMVADITCGSGVFFNFLSHCQCFGNEIDNKAVDVCRHLYPEVNLTLGDMRDYKNTLPFDYVVGNPPFNLDLLYKGEYKKSQMIYVEKSAEMLKKGGILAIIVPMSFLADEFSNKSDIEFMNEHFTFIGQQELKANTFEAVGVNNFSTKIIIFAKKSEYLTNRPYTNQFTDLNKTVKNFYLEYAQHRNQIKLENRKIHSLSEEFEFKVKKYLFDIKKALPTQFYVAQNLLQKFYTQEKPFNMPQDVWEKSKLTEEKVLRSLKKTISEQHGNRWGVKHLASQKEDKKQSIPFDALPIKKDIEEWLIMPIWDYMNKRELYLNDVQLEIVNKMLQKRYGYIQSSQGTGKTLMSIFYSLYRSEINHTKNTLVIAPSIAINTTWAETLQCYKKDYVNIKSLKDVGSIKEGEFILISFEMLCKYGKMLKKKIACNTTLILDEADSICNLSSIRSKAVLNVGKKLRYKLLLSGTMTRNNITEAYTQFLLMYGSSGNFVSENKYIMSEDKKTKELERKINPQYNKPFPHYLKGYKLFQESFNPRKITVFGAEQNTQDVFNPDELKNLINKSIITKTFEQVVGKNLYKIHQHNISMNDAEKTLYKKAIEEFHSMKHLFTSTGNARKDRMMEIIQQINLLLNICRHPNTYKEYNSTETPSKYKKVISLCQLWKNERVAIGTRTLKEVQEYKNILATLNRNIYIITGATSMPQRLEIIEQLRSDKTGILLSTQQSLSVSIDIDFVDKVVISSLSWNWSTISQYFFRFVRYTSENKKEIHIITYKNSLENNLLYLISQKENLTNFMKNEESENILDKLGVNYNLIDSLLIKSRDKDGVKIKMQEN